ncbi:UDP-glucosyltransferase 2-like [Nymphalis io]|uniref:UDP-glucosyltransferase 2-like n=1 Tax=Inachis io TaxID=171585 RepID=UPI002166F951|nr:UDP-glucosyltransferase 2-like [Nymphalis io]XP_050359525.1 UDP-glucosyltransferase 2-like [Nymphalis io]XP_050359526.1 UDP-glucosyltransferase 2-like [Nymphalis io]XP_050359527.1 UDP-glucosyltransferase 2-like [Nymphalis io]XP_050359528.1 UDP-glucosyltransferase 2-like [Nymphalis io]XP_050359529.1 UDP-glucosyltransferase 2-like [Nymphalis io]XP_050359531.1 UDP-glucosyltransferase 2-like [Nymphalis io]XP_050359532.1 UDP-glucosyltransferase 2-like [Nymphalis io]
MKSYILPLMFLSVICTASAYHILCLHHIPSMSHHNLGKGIVKALLKAGHKITWVTPYPDKTLDNSNITVIDVSDVIEATGPLDVKLSRITSMSTIKEITRNISQATLHVKQFREALVKNQYDAVVSEWFMSDVEAGYAAIQQVPWILISTIVMHPHLEFLVDTVRSVPTHPMIMFDFPIPMGLKHRLMNSAVYILTASDTWWDRSFNEALYKSSFEPLAKARRVTLPPYLQALFNISILFVNSHPSFSAAQSLPPNVIEIGGYHIDEDTPTLPEDLQKILDSSPQGAIYFSMGSLLKSSSLPDEVKQGLIKMLGELPYTVIWKYEEEIKNLPKNIHVRKWMPQNSILAHPNTRVFISHAGLLSTLEALHYGVPMLAIPINGDQPRNANSAVSNGRAIKVELGPDMVPEVKAGLMELFNNASYYNRMQYLSKLFRIRPVSPSKLISHYVELAIETKGAHHIRSPALQYEWYQLLMLDQLLVLFIVLYFLYSIVKIVFKLLKYFINMFKQNVKEKTK